MAANTNRANRIGLLTTIGALGAAIALVASLSFSPSFAVADNSGENETSFGIGASTSSTSTKVGVLSETSADSDKDNRLQVTSEGLALQRGTDYDVMVGVYQIERAREEERRAAEEAARIEEQQHVDQAMETQQRWRSVVATDGSASLSDLSEVDWTVGKEAFISTWAQRIDAYLKGSPLAGYGETFATAAWENGIDPRWSPAISNTESSKGRNCFMLHNAWGWGQSSWSSWSEAINAHVTGLASNYGYSIALSFAHKYCPPTYENWYASTVSEMKRI